MRELKTPILSVVDDAIDEYTNTINNIKNIGWNDEDSMNAAIDSQLRELLALVSFRKRLKEHLNEEINNELIATIKY